MPAPVPAANERSPNRKPRRARAYKLWNLRQAKRAFLGVLRVTGDRVKARDFIDRGGWTINSWLRNDEAFALSVQDIEHQWQEFKAGNVQGLEMKAIGVLERALDGVGKDGRLAADVAYKILRSGGLIHERSQTEVTGSGGGPVRFVHEVVVKRPGGEETAIIESTVKELTPGKERDNNDS